MMREFWQDLNPTERGYIVALGAMIAAAVILFGIAAPQSGRISERELETNAREWTNKETTP